MRSITRLALALPLLALPGLLLAASSMSAGIVEPLAAQLARAKADARSAEAEVQRLEKAARDATGEAERLRAQQAAAAEAIAAAEARISVADTAARIAAAGLEARRQRLAVQQAPAGSLLAGLALMASRPPMLAILDTGSTDDFVRVRVLLDSTLPVIRDRTAALSAEIEQGRRLQESGRAARAALTQGRDALAARKRAFAALEERALRMAERRGDEALIAGDSALARSEDVAAIAQETERTRSAARIAADLARLPPAPARPSVSAGERRRPPLVYRLPAAAPVVEGLGEVGSNGVRSRGLTLATRRGAAVSVPASGIVRFSGPFRTYDGIVIIDHGQGWMSLIVNVASPLEPGSRVAVGEPLGRSLGRIGVELSHNGRRRSPALIAGSSQKLSNGAKDD